LPILLCLTCSKYFIKNWKLC